MRARLGEGGCSWYAGGMLAPWCELETSEPLIAQLGAESCAWWRERFDGTVLAGTLVLAHGRDVGAGFFGSGHGWVSGGSACGRSAAVRS